MKKFNFKSVDVDLELVQRLVRENKVMMLVDPNDASEPLAVILPYTYFTRHFKGWRKEKPHGYQN